MREIASLAGLALLLFILWGYWNFSKDVIEIQAEKVAEGLS
jgi:hypothetical protein